MRKILFLLMAFGISIVVKSQVVNIPDANFKACLIEDPSINTNSDNEIQVSEAIAFNGRISCPNKNINDLTGIESFVNLTELVCPINNLTNLDISKNVHLKGLYCGNNQLVSLDVSMNIELINLYYENNKIANMDLVKNTVLRGMSCANNQLVNLDVSEAKNFAWLFCGGNGLLKSLNLKNGSNSVLTSIYVADNPKLTCIQVDDVANANSYSGWIKDATASYSTNCVLTVTENNKKEFAIYPNPAKDILNFSEDVSNIKITDLSGKIIEQFSSSEKSVNVSKLTKGTYIITGSTKVGKIVNKKFTKD